MRAEELLNIYALICFLDIFLRYIIALIMRPFSRHICLQRDMPAGIDASGFDIWFIILSLERDGLWPTERADLCLRAESSVGGLSSFNDGFRSCYDSQVAGFANTFARLSLFHRGEIRQARLAGFCLVFYRLYHASLAVLTLDIFILYYLYFMGAAFRFQSAFTFIMHFRMPSRMAELMI